MSLASSGLFSFLGFAIPIIGFTLPRLRHSAWPWEIQTDQDPTIALTPAPLGMTCRNTVTGALYMKVGPEDADWTLLNGYLVLPSGLITGDFAVTPSTINQIDSTQTGTVNANLPAAESVPNGTWAILAVHPAAAGPLTLDINPNAGDTINFTAAALSFNFTGNQLSTTLVSDGNSNWTEIARVFV